MASNTREANSIAVSPVVIVVMGVAGSGKTVVGSMLAEKLGWQFADADNFHSPVNVAKMQSGHPLNDDDRMPWLNTLAAEIAHWIESGTKTVLACSALRQSYRNILQHDVTKMTKLDFVYLKGDYNLFLKRLSTRQGHYMKADMLASQFATLEEPDDAIVVDASASVDAIVQEILAKVFSA